MATQKGWTVDTNQCTGCRGCEAACKTEYNLQIGQGRRRRVIEREESSVGGHRAFFTSLACNQCEQPACLKACPVGAYVKLVPTATESWHRDYAWMTATHGVSTPADINGVVLHDPAKCIGCRRCEWACPYGAPQFNPETKKMHKCEGCWQRIVQSDQSTERKVPACVATCIGDSIRWQDVDPTAGDGVTTDNTEDYDYGYTNASASNPSGVGATQLFVAPGPLTKSVPATSTGTNKPAVLAIESGRGSTYVADFTLTRPALKIRNRVYQTRIGGWE